MGRARHPSRTTNCPTPFEVLQRVERRARDVEPAGPCHCAPAYQCPHEQDSRVQSMAAWNRPHTEQMWSALFVLPRAPQTLISTPLKQVLGDFHLAIRQVCPLFPVGSASAMV